MARTTPPSYTGNPAAVPSKPVIQSFPTPNLDDRIHVVRIDARKPDFRLPDQGQQYAGPNAEKFSDFIFTTAKPTDQVGWMDLYYLNERDNQDDYNFEVAYPWADRDFPQYTRTYVVLRDDTRANEPQADEVDPVHDDLLLVDHKWIRLQDPILDALFIGIQRVYQRLPGPVLTDYEVNQFQQVVTIEEQDVPGDPEVPTPTATTEAWKTEGPTTAKAKITVSSVDEVFPDTRYQLEREDRILPFKFRTANPMETDSHIEEGTAEVPTLAQDDWTAEEHQTTEFKKFVSRSFRSVDLPVTLIDYKLDNDQRLVTVTDTWDNGLQTITPDTDLVDASVSNLGNDESIQSLSTVDGPFDKGEYSTRIPDLVPEKFRAAIPIETTALTSTGTAVMATLGAGELEHQEQQQTAFWKRVTSTGRDAGSLPITLVEYKLTEDKQIETVSETYDSGLQTITGVDELTVEAAVDNLGNDTSLLRVGVVPDLFTKPTYGTRIPDTVPERFRVAVPTTTSSLLSAGTATPPTLGTGDLSITEEQTNEFVLRTTTETRAGVSLPVTLVSYKMTRDKQVETFTEIYDSGLQTISGDLDELTVEADVQNLGNNTSLKALGTVGTLFGSEQASSSIPEFLPERFRASIELDTYEVNAAGTITNPPVLGVNEIERTETQLDAFTFKRKTATRDLGTPPVLQGQEYDQSLDVVVPYVEAIADAGDFIGTNRFEITPLGAGKELVKAPDLTALQAVLDAYIMSFPGTANIQLPDILESVSGIMEATSADGTYDETGAAVATWDNAGASASLSLSGNGQGSAAIIPDLAIQIRQVWANSVPTVHYLFFLPMPVDSTDVLDHLTDLLNEEVLAWPQFNPLAHTFVLLGQSLTLGCRASSNFHAGGSDTDSGSSSESAVSTGTGFSQEVGLTVRTVRIPPTIHEAIAVTGTTDEFASVTATASANAGSLASVEKTGIVNGSITPLSLLSTPGDSVIPASGKRILHIDAEPYRWGYARCHAEVVDFTDITVLNQPDPNPNPIITDDVTLYIRFWVQVLTEESTGGTVSADFFHIYNNVTAKLGFRYNYADAQWETYADGGDTVVIEQVIDNAIWYQIDLKLQSSIGSNVSITTRIDDTPGADLLELPSNTRLNNLNFGALNTVDSINKHYLFKLLLGTTGYGSDDVFDGRMDGHIVGPFDSRTGTGISLVNDHYLLINNAGSDAYASKAFTAITF